MLMVCPLGPKPPVYAMKPSGDQEVRLRDCALFLDPFRKAQPDRCPLGKGSYDMVDEMHRRLQGRQLSEFFEEESPSVDFGLAATTRRSMRLDPGHLLLGELRVQERLDALVAEMFESLHRILPGTKIPVDLLRRWSLRGLAGPGFKSGEPSADGIVV